MNDLNGNGASGATPFDEEMCERYLLGELSGSEQELFETAYFNDDSFFNRFLAVKDELLDLYSRNELDAEKRMRIERHFGSTRARRQRLAESNDFIRTVTTIADGSAPVRPLNPARGETFFELLKGLFTVPTLAAVSVLLVLVAVGIWIAGRSAAPDLIADQPVPQPTSGTAPSNVEVASENVPSNGNTQTGKDSGIEPSPETKQPELPESARNIIPDVSPAATDPPQIPVPQVDSKLTAPTPGPTPEQRVAEIVKSPQPVPDVTGPRTETVTLSSTSRSVTGRNTAVIGTATQNVVIRMVFGGDSYSSYSVRLTTLGGTPVWRASNLMIGGTARSLAVTVPASSLTRNDYIVILEGRTKDGKSEMVREYYMHVDRQ